MKGPGRGHQWAARAAERARRQQDAARRVPTPTAAVRMLRALDADRAAGRLGDAQYAAQRGQLATDVEARGAWFVKRVHTLLTLPDLPPW